MKTRVVDEITTDGHATTSIRDGLVHSKQTRRTISGSREIAISLSLRLRSPLPFYSLPLLSTQNYSRYATKFPLFACTLSTIFSASVLLKFRARSGFRERLNCRSKVDTFQVASNPQKRSIEIEYLFDIETAFRGF